MKAVQIVRLGAPLELHEVPVPEPGAGEILVRVEAAGMCHSDAHYQHGASKTGPLPITPGHEVAGIVEKVGADVTALHTGDRVALHYLYVCGKCSYCREGREQFCITGKMIGKDVDGGYAEFICAPAGNAIPVPAEVSLEAAAIMMCSSATAFHALRKARVQAGDRVAVFGAGGLGLSAVQLARICGARQVFAVDLSDEKLAVAARYGAIAVNPKTGSVEVQLRELTQGQGVDVALELVGIPVTQTQALACLAVQGRAAFAGIGSKPFSVQAYPELIGREAELIGVSDHRRSELVTLMEFARQGLLDLENLIADRIPLDANKVNQHLDALASFHGATRTVIQPQR